MAPFLFPLLSLPGIQLGLGFGDRLGRVYGTNLAIPDFSEGFTQSGNGVASIGLDRQGDLLQIGLQKVYKCLFCHAVSFGCHPAKRISSTILAVPRLQIPASSRNRLSSPSASAPETANLRFARVMPTYMSLRSSSSVESV